MKKKINLLIIGLLAILFINVISAGMPESHDYVPKKALEQTKNSPVGKIVNENWEDFIACQTMTDYSVFFYFEQGFNRIGQKYLASHNFNICRRAVSMASNNQELACAYGICEHEIVDNSFHNEIVPEVIKRTKLSNGIVHALAEEDINDQILKIDPSLKQDVRNSLINKANQHREFFIKVVQTDERIGDINVGNMIDAFVLEVTGSSKYSVGFRGFTAVPTSMHILLLTVFLLNLGFMGYLIRKKKRNKFNIISIFISLGVVAIIILAYVLFFTGNIWKFFQTFSAPLTMFLPTSGWEQPVNHAVQNTVTFFNGGVDVLPSIIGDPSGQTSLANADSSGTWLRTIISIVLFLAFILLMWLNFRKKRN